MQNRINKFWESKWVKIPLYLLSILTFISTLAMGFIEGEWPDSFSEIGLLLLLGGYVLSDLLVVKENKTKNVVKNDHERKIDEIGE
ncbi:MAG: hypothetical protein AAF696_16630 [Bacteroidota bacterium]